MQVILTNKLLIYLTEFLHKLGSNYCELICGLEEQWCELDYKTTIIALITLLIIFFIVLNWMIRLFILYQMTINNIFFIVQVKIYYHTVLTFFKKVLKFFRNTNRNMLVLLLPLDTPWNNFEIYFYVIFILAIILWVVNLLFSLRILDMDKGRGFECGLQSFFQTREQFHISFHRVSLLFLAFDLEIVIIYPAGGSDIQKVPPLFYNLLIFILILMVGFIYEISVNALDIFITELIDNWSIVDFR